MTKVKPAESVKSVFAVVRAAQRYVKARRAWESDPRVHSGKPGNAADELGRAVDEYERIHAKFQASSGEVK